MLTHDILTTFVKRDVGPDWVVLPQTAFSSEQNGKIHSHVIIQNSKNLAQILDHKFELDASVAPQGQAILICTALRDMKQLLK